MHAVLGARECSFRQGLGEVVRDGEGDKGGFVGFLDGGERSGTVGPDACGAVFGVDTGEDGAVDSEIGVGDAETGAD